MPQPANTEETRIKALLETWADAVRRHDVPAILAHHEPDMVMFDLPPPLQCKGIDAYERTWDLLFRYHKPGTAFDIQELAVTAGLRKVDGDWRVAHEHHSVPAND